MSCRKNKRSPQKQKPLKTQQLGIELKTFGCSSHTVPLKQNTKSLECYDTKELHDRISYSDYDPLAKYLMANGK